MSVPTSVTISPAQQLTVTVVPSIFAIKLTNKSFYDLQISGFGVSGTDWIAAGTESMLYAEEYNAGELTMVGFNLNSIPNPQPGAILIVQYTKGEQLPKGSWPLSIPSSSVNTVSNITTSVENDGNPNGTIFIGSIPLADGSRAVSITNDGIVQIGDALNNGSITVDGAASLNTVSGNTTVGGTLTVSKSTILAAVGLLTHILGPLTVDGVSSVAELDVSGIIKWLTAANQKIQATSGAALLDATGGTDLFLNPPNASTGAVHISTVGTNRATFDANGITLNSGALHFLSGQITKWDSINFTAPVQTYPGSFTFTHNFGYAPDSAWIQVGTSANSTGSATTGVWNWTTTTCVITLGAQLNGILWYKRNT